MAWSVDWDRLFEKYEASWEIIPTGWPPSDDPMRPTTTRTNTFHFEASVPLQVLATPTDDDAQWLIAGLRDNRSWFVLQLFDLAPAIAEVFFKPLLDGGIDELEPSGCRYYVTACPGTFGVQKTREYLYSVIEGGSDLQKAGATWCLYWSGAPSHGTSRNWDPLEVFPSEEKEQELRRREMDLLLQTFLATKHFELRNAILARLSFRTSDYPEELRPVLRRAVAKARGERDLLWLLEYRLSEAKRSESR